MPDILSSERFSWSAVDQAIAEHEQGNSSAVRFPVLGSDRSLFICRLVAALGKKLIIIVPDERKLSPLAEEIDSFLALSGLAGVPVVSYPRVSATPFDQLSLHTHIQARRSEAVARLLSDSPAVILLPVSSLLWGRLDAGLFHQAGISLELQQEIDPEQVAARLVSAGYTRRQIVQEAGEFAIRGFVIDVFSPDHGFPVRAELFGETIDSLRYFNTGDQKSLASVDTYQVMPMKGIVPTEDFEARLRGSVVGNSRLSSDIRQEMLEQIVNGEDAPWFWNVAGSEELIRPLGQELQLIDACVVIDEPDACRRNLDQGVATWVRRGEETGQEFRGWARQVTSDPEALFDFSQCAPVSFLSLDDQTHNRVIESGVRPFDIGSDAESLQASAIERLARLCQNGRQAITMLNSSGHIQRFSDVLFENDVPSLSLDDPGAIKVQQQDIETALENSNPILTRGQIEKSFEIGSQGPVFIGHSDVFGTQIRARTAKSKRKAFSIPVEELKPGDYIVHEDHGIGLFGGLKRIERGSDVQEFLQIEYAGGDRLLIPIDKMSKVQRYSTMEGIHPRLDKLGGSTWQKVKRRVKKALREMAGELMNLYAIRKTITGISFAPDNEMMREFENSFPHVETPDQEKSMAEIKADMESDRPMDRLLCGDVGYGKTELAMRAAVKAAISGKQIAVLAPTTILAQQHFDTFSERMQGFPFNVELLSRFRSKAEQKQVLDELASGDVAIVVGTHRILGADVKFKDLGLLIVDEEQRFGVGHKEKMKKMRKRIDVLSLTATPIPRTLHMSIAGVREMSLIQTPPRNRMAIHTRVLPFSDEVVRSAVEQEIERQGQVFYLRNRVEGIEQAAARISRLVPEARVVIAHARMSGERLEKVMASFVNGEYDVLVSTTIIENGIDIPNANTLIVERADRFGLSQLYQIRGRVGRSDRSAYAYLLVPKITSLSEDARRRLHAIREFSDLGSGFRIAAMDLEIRGAGTLLGGEQSGHIEAVGFDLYNRMLENTVKELQGEGVEEEFETAFNLQLDTHIPASFIDDASMRMKYYRMSMAAGTEVELEAVRDEMLELFGPLPDSVELLFSFATVRLLSARLRVERIDRAGERLSLHLTPASEINAQALAEILEDDGASFSERGILQVHLDKTDQKEIMKFIVSLLRRLT